MGDIRNDPSMEEILASIKRVIAEDGRAAAPRGRAEIPQIAPEDDVLELSEPASEPIVSEDTAAASRNALAALATASREEQAAGGDGPLEAVVRDMLRPMLKDWLDQRLPEMVEELVAREIARITAKH